MSLKEKIAEIRGVLSKDSSNDKFEILNKLLSENKITIIPKNINRKVINEGVRERTHGTPNDPSYHHDIDNGYSYELSCEFVISNNEEEIVFPSVQSYHVSHGDLLKMAYETMLYMLFGVRTKD